MKKRITLWICMCLCLILIFSLFACMANQEKQTASPSQSEHVTKDSISGEDSSSEQDLTESPEDKSSNPDGSDMEKPKDTGDTTVRFKNPGDSNNIELVPKK
ncbi:hypothetical protein HGO97_022055 [Faecalicatena sp. AGMB00832]|uniref:Uncharacterized protein n=1 Tax=Faecalicatena faecalis TaxID=2726362 RepID=A0ABS6DAK5_9FIRM|nr:hypothetical protein [Faecalicatena faecalis]MBU3878489.1 hypothetical protein [Faecalicatena faecalis]